MRRRDFLKGCAYLSACSLLLHSFIFAYNGRPLKRYTRALLVWEDGRPVKPREIKPDEEYIFFYPFRATPCILVNTHQRLGEVRLHLEDGTEYIWNGGIGPGKSIVAFVAICTHQLSYPTRQRTLISYHPPGKRSSLIGRDKVIQCCAHMSAFDPTKGGKVLEGPAKDPLPAVILAEDKGKVYAEAVLGKDLFEEFFDVYRKDLRKEYGSSRKAKERVDRCVVNPIRKYAREVIKC